MCDCKIKDLSQNLGTKQMKRLSLPTFMSQYFLLRKGLVKEYLWVDKCLADEIKYLWSKGITTTGCCCGHNFKRPYIGVTDASSYHHMIIASHPVIVFDHLVVASFVSRLCYKHTIPSGLVSFSQIALF